MATPNTSPTGTPEDKKQSSELLRSLERAFKLQGDYNNLLKDSVRELDKSIKNYDKIGAKLSAIDTTQINTKKLQNEIQKAQEKRYLNDKKIVDLNDALNDKQKKESQKYLGALEARTLKEKQLLTAQREGNIAMAISAQKALDGIEKQIELKESSLNIEQLAYAQAIKQQELEGGGIKALEEQLGVEEQISKQIGITGNAAALLSKKLGLGTDVMEAMVKGSRNVDGSLKKLSKFETLKLGLSAIKKGIKENLDDPLVKAAMVSGAFKLAGKAGDKVGSGFAKAGSALGGLNPDSANNISKLTSGLSGLLKDIPLVGGLIGGMVDGFSSMLDFVIGIDDTVIKAGRNLGLSSDQARKLNSHFADVSMNNGDIFVTSKKLLETQVALGAQLGINNQLTDEQLSTAIKLKDLAGLDAETQASIVESSTLTGKSAESTTKSVIAQVSGLQKATGISLNYKDVLKEASSLGGYLGLSFAKYPAQLAKSLVTTKAFGLQLKELDSLASSFLDFESSISSEFEAQLLTGKDINLSKAREAFLNNDLASAAQEISTQVGNSADFLSMNRIQAESMAKAFGMSRDQLGEMLKKQEFLSKIGAKETDNSTKQLELAKKRFTSQTALNEALGEEGYQNLINASTQEKMSSMIDKIKTSIVDFVQNSGMIEKVQGFIDYIAKPDNVRKIINSVKGFFADAVEFVGNAAYHIINALDYVAFGQIPNDFIDSIKSGAANMGAQIRAIGGDLGGASVSANAAKGSANSYQVAAAAGIIKPGETNVSLKIEQMRDASDKLWYRVINESTHKDSGWQTGRIS